MSWLSLLLLTKIAVTGLLVAAPFLFLPKAMLEKVTNTTAQTSALYRLYGVAIVALLVGYAFGIPSAEVGQFPWGVVTMGTVSNGGAALLLLAFSRGNKPNRFSAAFYGLVALGQVVAKILPSSAVQKAW